MGTLGTAGMRLDFDAGVDSDEYGPLIVVVQCRGPFQEVSGSSITKKTLCDHLKLLHQNEWQTNTKNRCKSPHYLWLTERTLMKKRLGLKTRTSNLNHLWLWLQFISVVGASYVQMKLFCY